MPINAFIPSRTISKKSARRFMLAHHFLWPPRKLKGKDGVLKLIDRVGCIQYDTINVVGRNADLVLQSRITNYTANLLEELLYQERELIDGWDKMASIYHVSDWPYFARRRKIMEDYHINRAQGAMQLAPKILKTIRKDGPLSSLDFKDLGGKTDWFWGTPTSEARAVMETLYVSGQLGVHKKVNTRRIFDLNERLIPKDIFNTKDPNKSLQDYHEWHALRRLGSLGLASLRSGEYWMGIASMKSPERKETIINLIRKGKVICIAVEEMDESPLFIRQADLKTLDAINNKKPKDQASIIAPLDNLIWNRKLVFDLFNFDYVWEVYKPKKSRKYGYYTLPILYGDKFIARMDGKLERKSNVLKINGWWWEEGYTPDDSAIKALSRCLGSFYNYLGNSDVEIENINFSKKEASAIFL